MNSGFSTMTICLDLRRSGGHHFADPVDHRSRSWNFDRRSTGLCFMDVFLGVLLLPATSAQTIRPSELGIGSDDDCPQIGSEYHVESSTQIPRCFQCQGWNHPNGWFSTEMIPPRCYSPRESSLHDVFRGSDPTTTERTTRLVRPERNDAPFVSGRLKQGGAFHSLTHSISLLVPGRAS